MSRPDSLATHLQRWQIALNGRMRWTREAWIDKLVAANKSWSPDDLDVFWGQNREPSNYPILHTVRESICGLEAQTRRDTVILARTRPHQDTAEALTGLVKYVDQQAKADYVRSKSFRNAVDVGVGWTETFYSDDPRAETIGKRAENPFHIWTDPSGREDDLSDYQDVFRARWLPRAWVDMRFDRARNMATGGFIPTFHYDPLSHTQNYRENHGDEPSVGQFNQGMGGDPAYGPGHGYRAPLTGMGWATQDADSLYRYDRYGDLHLLVERWYRADEWATFLVMRDGRVIETCEENAMTCARLLLDGKGKLMRAVARKIRCAIFVADGSGGLLQDVPSPYPHGQFPFTPTWGYRDEEGQPMGPVRLLRDAAREFNMRRTHATKRSLMQQVHMEEGTFMDDAEAISAIRKYNGVVRYQPGMLDKAKIASNADMNAGAAQMELQMMGTALQMVQNLGPVNQETLGQETNAKSGVAIENRQQQAHVALSHLFDNRNWAQQVEGEQTIALIQDSYTEEKEVRINGTANGLQYLAINQADPTSGAVINDISQGRYDVIVEEQPEAPTVRAAKVQAIAQVFQGVDLPPATRVQLAIFMAEAQDLPGDVIGLLKDAQKMASQPQPPQQQVRKSLAEIIKIGLPDLTAPERAQVLEAVGIQPDPNGPPPPPATQEQEQARPLDPNIVVAERGKLAVQQAKNEHEAAMTAAKLQHDAGQAAEDRHAAAAHKAFDAQHEHLMAGTEAAHEALASQDQHLRDVGLLDQQHQQARDMAATAPTPEPSPDPARADY